METKYFKNENGAVWQLSDGRVIARNNVNDIYNEYFIRQLSSFDDLVELFTETK